MPLLDTGPDGTQLPDRVAERVGGRAQASARFGALVGRDGALALMLVLRASGSVVRSARRVAS